MLRRLSDIFGINKGVELEEDPSKWKDGWVGDEVEKLKRDGEGGEGDEEVAPFLALVNIIDSPEGLSFFVCADVARDGEGWRWHVLWNAIDRKGGRREEKEREGVRFNESKQVEERKGENGKLGNRFV